MSIHFSRASLWASIMVAGLATTTSAWSATELPDLSALTPLQREHHAQWLAQRQKLARTQGGTYRLDIEAPKVLAFAAGTDVNLQIPNKSTLPVTLSLTDNMVGVQRVEVRAVSDSGFQEASGSAVVGYPARHTDLLVPVTFWSDADEGAWQVVSVSVYDANDNVTVLSGADLAAMGNTQFNVVNRNRSDGQAPNVNAGKVLTPTLSRSKAPKGEYPSHAARPGVELKVTDTGSRIVSGVSSASLTYCSNFGCFYLQGRNLSGKQGAATLTLGGQVDAFNEAGLYRVDSMQVTDAEGNTRIYYSFDTDFDSLFGGDSSITLTE